MWGCRHLGLLFWSVFESSPLVTHFQRTICAQATFYGHHGRLLILFCACFSIICNLQVVMYLMCFNALKSLFFLIPKWPILGQWEPLQIVSCVLVMWQISVSVSLYSGTRCPGSSSMFPTSDWNQPFLQEALILFSLEGISGSRADAFIYALHIGDWVTRQLKVKQNI